MKTKIKILFTILLIYGMDFGVKAQPNFRMAGFATENGGTTGGFGGDTVTATSYDELKNYAQASSPYVIVVQDTITNGPGGGQVNVNSNKTIIGKGNNAFLQGIGIAIGSRNNIVIRNIKITLVGLTTPKSTNDGDCISIYGSSKNIWIDHCELFSENPDIQTNIDKYDGLIDIKQQTGFITISWCYLHDHHKGGLVGAADDDLYADRKITFHHNYYNKVRLRVPMYRGSTGHFFNNYIVGAKDATEIRANTCVRVEKNYYEPLHYSIYTPSDSPGRTERIDNIEVSRTTRPYPENCVATIPYSYDDVLTENTADVKSIVPQWAGVGRLIEDCNGELGGSAYIDDCGYCVGGSTGKEACQNVSTGAIYSENFISVYPNPTTGAFYIECEEIPVGESEIQIYDQAGRLLKRETIEDKLHIISVKDLKAGSYVVSVSGPHAMAYERIIKL